MSNLSLSHYSVEHRRVVNVLTSDSIFLIFAVLVVWCSHSRLDQPSPILVWHPRLCSQLVLRIISDSALLTIVRVYKLYLLILYLSSRCFRVKCETDLSSWLALHIPLQCPQGSVFGPLLFVMYTIPLTTLISSCSLDHHFYADDTQLFLSFLPTHFDSSIDHLHNAPYRISS